MWRAVVKTSSRQTSARFSTASEASWWAFQQIARNYQGLDAADVSVKIKKVEK